MTKETLKANIEMEFDRSETISQFKRGVFTWIDAYAETVKEDTISASNLSTTEGEEKYLSALKNTIKAFYADFFEEINFYSKKIDGITSFGFEGIRKGYKFAYSATTFMWLGYESNGMLFHFLESKKGFFLQSEEDRISQITED